MRKTTMLAALTIACLCANAVAAEHDFYKNLRYPSKLVPGVGLDKVEQEGGPSAVGYKRRTVQWWPRKGQDIVDVPEGAPLRTWTRNKGQKDKEVLAGVCRTWTASDPETFKAHLIAFKGFGTSTLMNDDDPRSVLIPAAVLRLKNGEQRAIIDYGPVSQMVSAEDHSFIHETWEKAYPSLYAKVSREELPLTAAYPLKRLKEISPKFNGIEPAKNAKYPLWGERPDEIVIESPHFHTVAHPKAWGRPANWYNPDNIQGQNRYRKSTLEFLENFWTYVEAAGAQMPYWRRHEPNKKYQIHIWASRCAGGWGHCGIGDCGTVAFSHEFFHGQPLGGHPGGETMCNAGQHTGQPGEIQMFNGNFRYPWRNVNYMGYQSSLNFFALGDNPNWGYGIQVVAGCLSSPEDHTLYHTIARLGQKKGLWKNGVKGFGDSFGEYAARMVTCDFVEQYLIRSKYGMPEGSYLHPVYGYKDRYRISNAEAPRWCGYNIIRLDEEEGAKEIAVDFQGIHDPAQHSDWRACIVAVDRSGKARYSPLWNKGSMVFALKPEDKHLWLTVSASPSAFPVKSADGRHASFVGMFLAGIHAPRYPWEVTLDGCKPGTPHRKQGDIENFDDLYGRCDSGNTYLNYSIKHEVPIPLDDKDGKLAQEKLAAMLPRIKASADALQAKVDAGKESKGYFWGKKNMMHGDLVRRVKLLQENAKGQRHPNGGGFVADNARVAKSAYVGPNAMVFDGARVEDNACIKDFAVVFGQKTVISGNAKIGGRAWVVGDLEVSGNARILEAATVTTIYRTPRSNSARHEGQAKITGNAVIKGEPYLLLSFASNQVLTGGVVVDYAADINNRQGGVFEHGRFSRDNQRFDRAPGFNTGTDAGALYANWQFNQQKAVLLEDSYVNNNGILHGRPGFGVEGDRSYAEFNGKNQFAEAPPSVADFGELTIDIMVNRSGTGRLFDFGTSEDESFYLEIADRKGKLTLGAGHKGKRYVLKASEPIPSGKWVNVRVEMDGKKASIYIDDKQVANDKFTFSPNDVFIGDMPEGNFIACDRNKKEFFKGKLDHFRIYRQVHDNFAALGPVPSALTQIEEWSESGQRLADEWDGRKTATGEELKTGRYAEMQQEIKELQKQKSGLYKTEKRDELEKRVREAKQLKGAIDRKINDKYKALPELAETENEIKELKDKINVINRQISENSDFLKIGEDIKALENQRRELEKQAVEALETQAITAESTAAGETKRRAEERIEQLPELKKIVDQIAQEKDNNKKRELENEHRRLLNTRKLTDAEWQRTDIIGRRLESQIRDIRNKATKSHQGLKEKNAEIRQLHEKKKALEVKLKETHPELASLEKSAREKQEALNTRRKQFEEKEKERAKDEYERAEEAYTGARKAVEDEKQRFEKEKSKEFARIDADIKQSQKEADMLRENALKSAGVAGQNPYPGANAAKEHEARKQFLYHTTADWGGNALGAEETAPEKWHRWLRSVRGY